MKRIYMVMDGRWIMLVTSNINTALTYWQRERQKIDGERPNIHEWQLGKWNAYRQLGDEEVSNLVNERQRRIDGKSSDAQ